MLLCGSNVPCIVYINLYTNRLIRNVLAGDCVQIVCKNAMYSYRGADKSLARPGRKQATATEDFDVHMSYL